MDTQPRKIIPIYSTRGDVEAFLSYPYLYNTLCEWIGWVTPQRDVYSVLGHYVGYLTNDPRILRKRWTSHLKSGKKPPPPPPKINHPVTVPLPPMMPDLQFNTIDILQDEPDRLHTLDSGRLKEDMD
ncbi:MAG: hypothetical protein JXA13_13160 [Anaerolineales bacterium]|nr:hypothetical protein [Anaerolineales bacterium]